MGKKKKLSTLLMLQKEFSFIKIQGLSIECTVCKCLLTAERSKLIRHEQSDHHKKCWSAEGSKITEFYGKLSKRAQKIRLTKHLVENKDLRIVV